MPRSISYNPVSGIIAVACPLQRIRLYKRCQPSLSNNANMLSGRYGQGQQVVDDINFEIISIISTDNTIKSKLRAIAMNSNNNAAKKVYLRMGFVIVIIIIVLLSSLSRVRKPIRIVVLTQTPTKSWRSPLATTARCS